MGFDFRLPQGLAASCPRALRPGTLSKINPFTQPIPIYNERLAYLEKNTGWENFFLYVWWTDMCFFLLQ